MPGSVLHATVANNFNFMRSDQCLRVENISVRGLYCFRISVDFSEFQLFQEIISYFESTEMSNVYSQKIQTQRFSPYAHQIFKTHKRMPVPFF